MFNIDREELKMEIEGELARLAPQAGRGYRVRALVVHPYCDPIVAWVPTDYAAVYCIVGGPPEAVKLETGVSRSELLGVTWRDLDLENGILHINQGLVSYVDADRGWVTESDGLKNAYRRRAIPIVEPELLKRLREKPRRIKLKRKTPYGEDFYVDTEQGYGSSE